MTFFRLQKLLCCIGISCSAHYEFLSMHLIDAANEFLLCFVENYFSKINEKIAYRPGRT